MPLNEVEAGALSRSLGERLRQGDADALREVYTRFAPAVISQLRSRFASSLDEPDLEDVASQALMRVWNHRHRYDARRSSMYTWFYLLARSQALDALRRKTVTPIVFSDLAQELPVTGYRRAVPTSPPTLELQAVQRFLEGLPEQDREILLSSAGREANDAWAAELATTLHIPASTIRSKKHRAMLRLRDEMAHQGFISDRGEKMSLRVSESKIPPHFSNYDFLQKHSDQIEFLIDEFSRFCQSERQPGSTHGFPHFSEQWNRAHERGALDSPAERDALVNTYVWLCNRRDREDRYRYKLTKFIQIAMRDSQLKESAFAREGQALQLHQIEASMAGLGRGVERTQPAEIARYGQGVVHVRWSGDDAQLAWDDEFDSPVALRGASSQAFSLYGELPTAIASQLAVVFVNNVKFDHVVLPTRFEFEPDQQDGVPPQRLLWSAATSQDANPRLPKWMENNEQDLTDLPDPAELDLLRKSPELARLLDELLIKAAMHDSQASQGNHPADQPTAIQQLTEIIAYACDCAPEEVAQMFATALRARQSKAESARECGANTEALLHLWSQLEGMH